MHIEDDLELKAASIALVSVLETMQQATADNVKLSLHSIDACL